MLRVGLTGGIGAGKSAVSRLLVQRGAALVDADAVAREVVEPGTDGLAAVVRAFGPAVLLPEGALDRAALGRVVFGDDDARARLNAIVHPLIGRRSTQLVRRAEATGAPVLVHDVPLLVEHGLGPLYHLVIVVEAPQGERMRRLVDLRGMPRADAEARMAAQADDDQRRAAAEVVLGNGGALRELEQSVAALWQQRLLPYADNLGAARPARRGGVVLAEPDPTWAGAGARVVARVQQVCGDQAVSVRHIGSTAVPGLASKPILDVQIEAGSWADVEALGEPLRYGGFPRLADVEGDPPRAAVDPDPAQWRKHLHLSADPGRPVNLHVRVVGSAAARCAVALRDLLRADAQARADYQAVKRRLAAQHPHDVDAYAEGKTAFLEPLFVRALAAARR